MGRGKGKRRVIQCGGFLLSQQRLSISQRQRHSLEEGSSGGGSDCAAPCVASFPLLTTSTTGAVGLWELPALSLQRHDNMQGCPQGQLGSLRRKGGCQTPPLHLLGSQMTSHHTFEIVIRLENVHVRS